MSFVELLLVAVGLSMDAFAVSVCKGLSVKKLGVKHALIAGAYFGGFQFLMPVIGWFLGSRFEHIITSFDHWIAFGLLAIIGVNMIQESFSKAEELNDDFGVKTMLMMAVATSIDALAVGVTFACLDVSILPSSALIGEEFSSTDLILPFLTLTTTSAIFAMFWLCVTTIIVFP